MRRFTRTTITHGPGTDAALVVQARVIDVNVRNWTVDVRALFDRKFYFEVQVGSPYLHYNNGEGLSIMPEVGAKCMVCIPGDTSPPFIMAFVMPFETRTDAGADELSTDSPSAVTTGASFAGGRVVAKPGDISLKTRSDNFVVLHREGVLQIGATPVCQRIYIPLRNLITDVSGSFAHHNTGGTISWGIQEGASIENPPSQYMHTFRVFANDEFADIRVACGKVLTPVPEPDGDSKGESESLGQLKIGTEKDEPIIYEVTVAPKGFDATTGALATPGVRNSTVLRFFFDRAGGTFLRAAGNTLLSFRKKLRIKVKEELEIFGDTTVTIESGGEAVLRGDTGVTVAAPVVRLGKGQTPASGVGDIVQVILPFTPMISSPTPLVVSGTVLTGNAGVLI